MRIQIKFKENLPDKEMEYTNMYTENNKLIIINKDINNHIIEECIFDLNRINNFSSWSEK